MDRQLFNESWLSLLAVFPSDRITEHTQAVYFQQLQDIPDEIWAEAVKEAINDCRFFPTVNELGVFCFGEEKGGMVEKCDPWRTRQFFKEYVPPESWRQRLTKHIEKQQDRLEHQKVKAIGGSK